MTIVITRIKGLITLLITTHEPPSRVLEVDTVARHLESSPPRSPNLLWMLDSKAPLLNPSPDAQAIF